LKQLVIILSICCAHFSELGKKVKYWRVLAV